MIANIPPQNPRFCRKIGLLSLVSIVVGSQIGSGALNSPAIFAPLGLKSMYVFLIASFGAMCIAYVFAQLSVLLPKANIHTYIGAAFGQKIGWYFGVLYWMISWVSTIVVLIAGINYLNLEGLFQMLFGLAIWWIINWINLKGVELSTKIEVFLTVLKVAFFAVFIIIPLFYFDTSNFNATPVDYDSTFLSAALWGFIGIEVAAAPAEHVHNAKTNIGRGVLIGTGLTAMIYMLGNIAALGCANWQQLSQAHAPYVLIGSKIFGTGIEHIIAFMGFLLCLGSLNAWTLASAQIAIHLQNDNNSNNQNNAKKPIIISCIGVSALWCIGLIFKKLTSIVEIIDLLTPSFIVIYFAASCSLFKISKNFYHKVISIISIGFCVFLLTFSNFYNLLSFIIMLILGLLLIKFIINDSKYTHNLC